MKKIILSLLISAFILPAVSLAAFDKNLSYGASSPAVADLQNFLAKQGFYSGPITGNFFRLTKNALIAFQKQKNLPASGFFGPLTRGVINTLLIYPQSSSIQITVPTVTTQQPVTAPPTSMSSTSPSQAQTLPATTTLPTATASQIAGIGLICSTAAAQGNTATIQVCNDGTLLNGYNTNAVFRNKIDAMVQQLIAQQGATALNAQVQAQNLYIQYLNSQQQSNQALQNQLQLQQLQNTLQQTNSLLQQQYWQKELQQQTVPMQTHCGIDAGVWRCGLPGFE